MEDKKKKDIYDVSDQVANYQSRNMQAGTNASIDGMNLLKWKADRIQSVNYEQAKGNLFEYIEAAKFNKNAANIGDRTRAVITDEVGRPHDAADIELVRDGKIVREVQAKFSKTKNSVGQDTSAASSISMQRGDKYQGMQRLVRKQEDYTVNKETSDTMSLVERAKELAEKRADSDGLYAEQYRDVAENLTDELVDDSVGGSGVSSGGTTLEEIQEVVQNPEKYARQFELEQLKREVCVSAVNAAIASAVLGGIFSSIDNFAKVYNNEQELDEAIKNIAVSTTKGAVRGASVSAVSSNLRYAGTKHGIKLLTDSAATTAIAGGFIESAVALWQFSDKTIDEAEFCERVNDTLTKTVATVSVSKMVGIILNNTNPMISMVSYAVSGFIISGARNIKRNTKLETETYERMTAIENEAIKKNIQFKIELERQIADYTKVNRMIMLDLMTGLSRQLDSIEDIEIAIKSLLRFAENHNMELQYTDYDDFCSAMENNDAFVLQ